MNQEFSITTYRAQPELVCRSPTGVQITHIRTGINVRCDSERTQYNNRAKAMTELKARISRLEGEQ